MNSRSAVLGLVLAVGLVLAPALPAASAPDNMPRKTYANCKALNKVYPHGVGKSGAKDKVSGSGKKVTNFKVSTKVYKENKKSDRDKDGIACEKK